MVTGASGFVGRAVLRALRAQHRPVVAIGTPFDTGADDGIAWDKFDLLDPAATRLAMARHRPDMLIHTAWARTRPGGLWNAEDNLAWTDAGMDLFESFWAEGGQQIVACGSCAEYGRSETPCREDVTPIAPTSIYGRAKAELATRALKRADALGMQLAWGRLFYLYGPHEARSRLVASVIDRLLAGKAAETTQGLVERDFSLSDDVGNGLVALGDAGAGGAFNIASGEAIALRDLTRKVGALMDAEDRLKIGALEDRPNEAPLIAADMAKTHAETGWQVKTPLEEGLARTIAWRRAHPLSNSEAR
ncbi:NAD-dependent epimerase/dehydratase family protein [Croceicoccus mobilis]|nr:NAD(P)-dependent oxidoreductase [Croceicoccus mobilis]